jgi:hypothetical protein
MPSALCLQLRMQVQSNVARNWYDRWLIILAAVDQPKGVRSPLLIS